MFVKEKVSYGNFIYNKFLWESLEKVNKFFQVKIFNSPKLLTLNFFNWIFCRFEYCKISIEMIMNWLGIYLCLLFFFFFFPPPLPPFELLVPFVSISEPTTGGPPRRAKSLIRLPKRNDNWIKWLIKLHVGAAMWRRKIN